MAVLPTVTLGSLIWINLIMKYIFRKLFRSMMVVVFLTTAVFCQQNSTPKNIILLIGDGMGLNAVTASILSLENDQFKKFKSVGLSVTCSADKLITDSAAGATALATGYKTNNGKISQSTKGNDLKTLFEFAKGKDLSTGLIATISFTNATPACFYAHNKSRHNEVEIAEQFLNSGTDVAISSGTQFLSTKLFDKIKNDSITFLDSIKNRNYSYFGNYSELQKNDSSNKILALFENYSLPKAPERNYSLGDLTDIALNKLSQNKNGFVLMVEGSLIDKGAEGNDYNYMIGEVKDFNTAINAALDFAEKDGNTLVVVTSDHESGGFAIVGEDKKNIDPRWAVLKSHTAAMVGIFSYGPGSEKFHGIMQNNELGRILINYLEPDINW